MKQDVIDKNNRSTEIINHYRKMLSLGRKIPCHAFTQGGLLLLAQGERIASQFQLDRLWLEDVVFSQTAPTHLVRQIQERQKALGIVIEDVKEDEIAVDEQAPAEPDGEGYENSKPVAFEHEIINARKLHDDTITHVTDLLENIRNGRPIDAEATYSTIQQVMKSLNRNERAFSSLLRLKRSDQYTFTHSINTFVLSVVLARHSWLNCDINALGLGALLHDIGKALLPVDLLHKSGELNESEWAAMHRHPTLGLEIAEQSFSGRRYSSEAIKQHHERLDGSGYPDHLRGDDISLAGRIVAIADTYDAMTSDRPHRKAFDPPAAMRWISAKSGELFDPQLVQAFISAIGVFPVGSVVRLNTGEIAVVMAINSQRVLCPLVLVLMAPSGERVLKPYLLDLEAKASQNTHTKIVSIENPESYGIDIHECLSAVSEEAIASLREQTRGKSSDRGLNGLDNFA